MPPRGSRRVLESSRKASYCRRGIARKHNYTLLVSLCPAAKRHGSRIKEMCLTVNNILGYSIVSCRNYFNQIYRIFDRGQTHCHSGLFCLGSLLFCHSDKGVPKGFIRSSLWPLTNLGMTAKCFFVPSPMVAIFWNCSVKQHTVYIQNSEFLVASLRTSLLDVPKNSLRKKHQNRGAQSSQQGIIAANYSVVLARRI